MISVIMTTHQGRKDKCEEAIKSVLAQTYTDWNLYIVDDGSHDGTQEMVEKYADKPIGLMTPVEAVNPKDYPHDLRIRYIRRNKPFGCDTRPKNEGIKASTGEYVAFLDSDNRYRPDHLQVLYNEITKSNVDIVYGDRWLFGEVSGMGVFHEFDPYLLLRRNYIDTSDVLIKRNVLFKVGGFDERYKKYVDWNLWVRLAKAGYSFKHVPTIITDYYVGKDTKSATKQDEKAFNVPAWDPIDTEIEVNSCLHEVKEPKVAIFSLTYDRLEMTKKCFKSLYKTAKHPFKHYIIDNGSTDGTKEYLEELRKQEGFNVRVMHFHDNRGISIASNDIVDEIMADGFNIVVKVDPDALFLTDGWLSKMVEIWKSNRMMILSPYIQGLKDNPGGAPRLAYGNIKGEIVGLTRHIGGIVCFADTKVYKDFRWDEHQPLHSVQDLEFSTYARMKGYQPAYLENYFVSHGPEGTEGQKIQYPEYFKRREFEKSHAYGEKE